MRILLTTDAVGGVWQFTERLAAELCHGNDVWLVSFGRVPNAFQQQQMDHLKRVHEKRFHFTAATAPLEWMPDNEHAYASGAALLEELALEFKPDLVHSNQFCWGRLAEASAAFWETPILLTAHSDVLSWAAACRPGGLEESDWLTRYKQLVQQGLDGAFAVTAPTRWMLQALEAGFNVPRCNRVIPNGASADTRRRQEQTPQRKLQAVTAGRLWDEGKNIQLLTEVKCELPVLIAGEQVSTHATFPALNTDSGSVQFLGQLTETQLSNLLLTSAFYICPSRYEPFGLAALDAAQHGCALLLHDIASLREVWGVAAHYFRSAAELEALLRTLRERPSALRRAQHRAVTRASELTASRTAERYLNLYRELQARAGTSLQTGDLSYAV